MGGFAERGWNIGGNPCLFTNAIFTRTGDSSR